MNPPPRRKYKGSKGWTRSAGEHKEQYVRRIKRGLENHLEKLEAMNVYRAIPPERRKEPDHYVRDRTTFLEWDKAARTAAGIRRELSAVIGEKSFKHWSHASHNPTKEFVGFVEQELEDLQHDFPQTKDMIPRWKDMMNHRRSIIQDRALTELEKAANLLYLVRCRRRMSTADRELVLSNLPF